MAVERRVVIGSRSSSLSLAQTNEVVRLLLQAHPLLQIDLVPQSTRGDRNKAAPLLSMERGMFVKEIEFALLNGEIDIAVHSAKDMPATTPSGLAIAAFTVREDARDVLVNRWNASLDELPAGARLGTSSPRRTAQIKAARPDLEVLPIRGNVDTRLSKANSEGYDGAILAAAGIARLGRQSEISAYLPPDVCVPDVGQGALAVQVRESDGELLDCVQAIDHAPTSAAVRAERAFLETMGGGCTLPTAAYAEIAAAGSLQILAMVAKPDGSEIVRVSESHSVNAPIAAGQSVAETLLEGGAARILEAL
ncbi:MAG: hydroxymethylbilane synthase [Chloroflexi bacterium]|nr:hydroxymethylbilane synthase [Chloroflexota bacterium]